MRFCRGEALEFPRVDSTPWRSAMHRYALHCIIAAILAEKPAGTAGGLKSFVSRFFFFRIHSDFLSEFSCLNKHSREERAFLATLI